MERNERLKAADRCASRYTNENEARIARKAFMLGCEFEAQGEAIKGVILDTLEEQEVKEQKSQDTVGRVSVEIRSNLQTDEVVRKTLIMLVNDGRISVTGAITSSDILNWLEGQKEPEVDFEQELYNRFGMVKDFTLGMRIAQCFYNLGKNAK